MIAMHCDLKSALNLAVTCKALQIHAESRIYASLSLSLSPTHD